MTTPPGWYPDPYHRFEFRYHNGTAWTRDVSVGGRRFVDAAERSGPSRPTRRATTALVFAIIGVSLALFPLLVVVGIGFAIAGITLGVGAIRDDAGVGDPRFARAAVVTGGAGLLLSVVGIWFTVITYRAVDAYVNPAPNTVTLDRCEVVDGTATVEGRVTNHGDDEASFTVRLDIDDADTGRRLVRTSIDVDDVGPSESGRFEVQQPMRDRSIDCDVTGVDGPLPFGIDIG